MGDDQNGEDASRLVVTSAKKLYGSIQELSIQLESLSSRSLEVEDLFAPDLQAKRLAIKDCCEQLFSLSPKSYGSVARDKLWRFALYDGVNKARKLQRDRQWTPLQLDLVKAHLQGGIGVLKLYILKLKGLCELSTDPVGVRMDSIDKWLEDGSIKGTESVIHGDQKRTWITDLAHLCTINIGDLYRYMKEMHAKSNNQDLILEAAFYETGAQAHYAQAFLLRPDSGLAFNQLGNLYCDVSGSLQSAYYLLYSIQSVNAYEGAYPNLRQLLDRKIVQFARLPASVEPKAIDTLVNNVLSLMNYFLFEHTQLPNYERHCQEALTNFSERLLTCDPEMDDRFLFHLSSICVMTVWRLQTTNSGHTPAAVAFAISLFCQLINQLTSILEEHAHMKQMVIASTSPSSVPSEVEQISDTASLKNNEKYESEEEVEEEEDDDDDDDDEQEENTDTTTADVFVLPKRRRRVRHRGDDESDSQSERSDAEKSEFSDSEDEEINRSEDSDSNGGWSSDEDDCNDSDNESERMSRRNGSEYSLKIENRSKAFDCSSSNGNSSSSGSSRKSKDVLQGNSSECEARVDHGISDPVEKENENRKFVIEVEDLLKCRSRIEAMLIALSPFLRWIQATSVIKDALAANAEKTFLEKLCTAINLLISQDWPTVLNDISLPELSDDWVKLCSEPVNEKHIFKWELDEDRSMLGIPQLQDFVNHLQLRAVTTIDALVIRIGRMVAFGSWMVTTESFSMLYNLEEKKFFVATPQTLKAYLLDSKIKRLKEKMKSANCEEINKLSKAYNDMKLRSKENKGRTSDDKRRRRGRGGGGGRQEAVFALVDLEAVLKRFKIVKRIASHRKFIVTVPSTVWKTLDMLKDSDEVEGEDARIAFRWLDAAMKRGHPGISIQKEQQKQKINFPYPRDHLDVDAWAYYDMMEYCNYIANVQLKTDKGRPRSNAAVWGDVRDKCKVFYLTGHADLLNTKIPRSYDPVKIARNVGIYVDHVKLYPGLGRGKKWKSVAKSNG